MFDNIGKKIKALAQVVCWIGIIGGVILGLILLIAAGGRDSALTVAIIILIASPLVSWISSFVLYGYGELIDKTADIAEYTRKFSISTGNKTANNGKVDELKKLLAQGLITQEEYDSRISKTKRNKVYGDL